MSQDTFNKLVTTGLMLFFATMYVVSFITGKPIDWQGLIAFAVPTINHLIHQFTSTQLQLTTIKSNGGNGHAQSGVDNTGNSSGSSSSSFQSRSS